MTRVIPRLVGRLLVVLALVTSGATIHADWLTRSPQETSMQEVMYTLGVWKPKPGQTEEFISAWKALGQIFSELPHPPGTGTLIQSLSDPNLFYSFGPWKSLEDIQSMRADPRAQAGIQRLVDLCTEATPGSFRVVAEAPSRSRNVR